MSEFIAKNDISIDLVDYLISKGFPVVKSGNSYKIKVSDKNKHSGDFSSLSIFPNRQSWKRWSDGTHGGDIIEFLRVVYGMSFQDAVKELGGGGLVHVDNVPIDYSAIQASSLVLPECSEKYSRLYAYLIHTRGIAPEIVTSLVLEKYIYQDIRNNVVFLGRDDSGSVRFACVRGTHSDVPFKKDVFGSDKRFSFSVLGEDKTKLYIFESPIDLLSAGTMANAVTNNICAWRKNSRLSLAGLSDVALEYYLKMHHQVRELHFWLDNDCAGRSASDVLCRKYSGMGFITFNHCPHNKDFNDDLKEYLHNK